jgi:hypothetical protein
LNKPETTPPTYFHHTRDGTIDSAQQVIGGHVVVEVEAEKQRLLPDRSLAHHGPVPVAYDKNRISTAAP